MRTPHRKTTPRAARTVLCALALSLAAFPAAAETALTSLTAYYSKLESALVARGALRADRTGGRLDAATLERDFIDIALFSEYGGALSAGTGSRAAKPLLRWEEPVRMQVIFGQAVGEGQRRHDRRAIGAYATKLARITGHRVSLTDRNPNFHVLVVSEAERQGLARQLPRLIPGISPWMVRTVSKMRASHLCMVIAEPHADPRKGYARAVAILRAEQSDLMRASCIEEELAQGMGLPNDCRAARPSIFNDDQEFAFLTRRDEVLLQMLYRPELASGMTAGEARPVVARLARTFSSR